MKFEGSAEVWDPDDTILGEYVSVLVELELVGDIHDPSNTGGFPANLQEEVRFSVLKGHDLRTLCLVF